MTSSLIIAVDGPAASGKGSIASRLAAHYGLRHLDTGLLYRATGLKVLAAGGDLGDAEAAARAAESVTPGDLIDETALTSRGAGEAASRVASHPGVRAALLKLQQDFARQAGGAVLDGRDIGTVIAPDAPVKLFVTAAPETRARRRWLQLTGRGEAIAFEDMLADIIRRDERDAGRGAAPMVMADDAAMDDLAFAEITAGKLFVQKGGEIVAGGGEGVGHEVDVVSEKGFGARTESTRRLNGDVRQWRCGRHVKPA